MRLSARCLSVVLLLVIGASPNTPPGLGDGNGRGQFDSLNRAVILQEPPTWPDGERPGAWVYASLDIIVTPRGTVAEITPVEAHLATDPPQPIEKGSEQAFLEAARIAIARWRYSAGPVSTRYRVSLGFEPPHWQRDSPRRLVGVEPYLPPAVLPSNRRVLVRGSIGSDGRLHGISVEGAQLLIQNARAAAEQWRYIAAIHGEAARFTNVAAIMTLRPDDHPSKPSSRE